MHLTVVWCMFLSAVLEEYKLDSLDEVYALFLLSAYSCVRYIYVDTHAFACASVFVSRDLSVLHVYLYFCVCLYICV